jgi:hypothetical protein
MKLRSDYVTARGSSAFCYMHTNHWTLILFLQRPDSSCSLFMPILSGVILTTTNSQSTDSYSELLARLATTGRLSGMSSILLIHPRTCCAPAHPTGQCRNSTQAEENLLDLCTPPCLHGTLRLSTVRAQAGTQT